MLTLIHGRKIPKFLDQIFDRDNHLVGTGCRHVFQCHCGGRPTGHTLSQKEHEAVLETSARVDVIEAPSSLNPLESLAITSRTCPPSGTASIT